MDFRCSFLVVNCNLKALAKGQLDTEHGNVQPVICLVDAMFMHMTYKCWYYL